MLYLAFIVSWLEERRDESQQEEAKFRLSNCNQENQILDHHKGSYMFCLYQKSQQLYITISPTTIRAIVASKRHCSCLQYNTAASFVSVLISAEAIWAIALDIIKGTVWFTSWNIPTHGWIFPVLLILSLTQGKILAQEFKKGENVRSILFF